MHKYIAFLRGINVGGNKITSMNALKNLMESLGFQNVKTVLASGNILFETEKKAPQILEILRNSIDKTLVILKTAEEITSLVYSQPFKDVSVSKHIQLYVTFFAEQSSKDAFKIVDLSKEKSTDWMKSLDKQFGKEHTTRNWNTILKIVYCLQQDSPQQ